MKHHNLLMDFSNLDFKKIDTEVLADEAKEQEETKTSAAMEKDGLGRTLLKERILTSLLSLFRGIFILPFFFFFFGKRW